MPLEVSVSAAAATAERLADKARKLHCLTHGYRTILSRIDTWIDEMKFMNENPMNEVSVDEDNFVEFSNRSHWLHERINDGLSKLSYVNDVISEREFMIKVIQK